MPIYEQVPIRLEADLVSAPPVAPIDANTGKEIALWAGQSAKIQVGIFDAANVAVDLSNLTYLQLVLQAAQDSLVPIFEQTVEAGDIIPTITRGGWTDGLQQQAEFDLSNAMTDVGLSGMQSAPFWIALIGKTADGAVIVYAAGYITIYNPGYTLPAPNRGIVSRHDQASAGGNVTVNPLSQVHTEKITVSGSAGTRKIVVNAAGLIAGAQAFLRFVLPATAGIVLQIYDQATSGDLLATIETQADGFTPSAICVLSFDGANFDVLWMAIPANGTAS